MGSILCCTDGEYETSNTHPVLNAVLQELVDGAGQVLGDNLIAAWLQGSFAQVGKVRSWGGAHNRQMHLPGAYVLGRRAVGQLGRWAVGRLGGLMLEARSSQMPGHATIR